jgi:hypothetical protein
MREPLTIEGFYATRLIARRIGTAAAVTVLIAGALVLLPSVILGVAADVLFFALVIR